MIRHYVITNPTICDAFKQNESELENQTKIVLIVMVCAISEL